MQLQELIAAVCTPPAAASNESETTDQQQTDRSSAPLAGGPDQGAPRRPSGENAGKHSTIGEKRLGVVGASLVEHDAA